jgi:hypothetical protein
MFNYYAFEKLVKKKELDIYKKEKDEKDNEIKKGKNKIKY